MQTKNSKLGSRFFAHDRSTPSRPSNGETQVHLALKTLLTRATRVGGWEAELEAVPRFGDARGWRADVLATDPSTTSVRTWKPKARVRKWRGLLVGRSPTCRLGPRSYWRSKPTPRCQPETRIHSHRSSSGPSDSDLQSGVIMAGP
jgi:hypothetical protein